MPGREAWFSLCVLGIAIGGETTRNKLSREQLIVRGVEEGVFADHEDIGSLIVQNAVNDISEIVEHSDEVVDVRRRRRLDEETNGTSAVIDFSALIDTCAELGFTSVDDCAAAFDEELTDAAESGELAERINYWANYYGVGTIGGVTPQENVTTWVFAPTSAPTLSPSELDLVPTGMPAPSPTLSPQPTETFAPTTTPMPSSSPEPTLSLGDETTGPTTAPSVPFDPISTLPPIIAPSVPRSSKSSNNNNQATLIIILVIVALVLLCCCCIGLFCYRRQQERKATERKDSWDIDTMLAGDGGDNLPESDEVLALEPGDDEGSSNVVVVEGEESQLVPVEGQDEEQDPQYLQKITQAAEL